MVQAMIEISQDVNQVLNIVKARYNLTTKSEAIAKVVRDYGASLLEPKLRPEYVKKLNGFEEEKGISFNDINQLRKLIEG